MLCFQSLMINPIKILAYHGPAVAHVLLPLAAQKVDRVVVVKEGDPEVQDELRGELQWIVSVPAEWPDHSPVFPLARPCVIHCEAQLRQPQLPQLPPQCPPKEGAVNRLRQFLKPGGHQVGVTEAIWPGASSW